MKTVSPADLKKNLKSILSLVKRGKTVIITSQGTPIAEIIPYQEQSQEAMAGRKSTDSTAISNDIVSTHNEPWDVM